MSEATMPTLTMRMMFGDKRGAGILQLKWKYQRGLQTHSGCAEEPSFELQIANGVLEIGPGRTSLISQLVSSGKTPNAFAHCLDGETGGGVLVIGHIVEPNITMTPSIYHEKCYIANLKGIDIDGRPFSSNTSFSRNSGMFGAVDSGTLTYLPEEYYKPITAMILSVGHIIKYEANELFLCFCYNGTASINKGFPTIKLKFEGSVSIHVYPYDYLLHYSENTWCISWIGMERSSDHPEVKAILADLVLHDKRTIYDIQNQRIGFKDHKSLSGVTMKGDKNPKERVAAHTIERHLAPPRLYQGKSLKSKNFFIFGVLVCIPTITLNFEGSVSIHVFPRDYLLHYYERIGMDRSSDHPEVKGILGDLVLRNKLTIYDIENQRT